MNKFISGRIKSLGYAFKGAYLLLKTEHAVITQAILGLLFLFLGFYFHINRIEWILQLFAIGLVLSVERCMTALNRGWGMSESHTKASSVCSTAGCMAL